jgi:hypothetical protein
VKSASAALAPAPVPSLEKFKRRRAGHLAISFRWAFYNMGRLTAGKTQLLCVEYVLSETVSASRQEGEDAPSESRPISTEEFAWFTGESLRTVQAALDDVCERKVLVRRMVKRGVYVYSAPVETWDKLPAFVAEKKPVDSADSLDSADDDTEAAGEEQANIRRRKLRLSALNDKPQALAPGRPSKAFELTALIDGKQKPVPVEKVQFDCNAPAQVDPVMHRGILRISIRMGSNGTAQANNRRSFNAENCVENGAHAENKEVSAALSARAAPLKAAVSRREEANEMGLWRDAMNRWFRPTLGPVPDDIVRQAISGAGVATREDCLRKLEVRKAKGFCKTWGGVVLVIREVGEAAAKARPVQSTNGHRPGESAADIEARRREDQLDTLRVALRFIDELPEHPDAIAQRELVQAADPKLVEQARATL